MASADIINTIIDLTKDMLVYMLPVIALMAGITFIFSFLISVTIGQARRIFRG